MNEPKDPGCNVRQEFILLGKPKSIYCDDPIVFEADDHETEKINEHLEAISNAGMQQAFIGRGLCEWHRNYFANEGVIPS